MSKSEQKYQKLKEKYELLKGLLDNLPGCAPYRIVTNPDGTIDFGFMGGQVQELLGYTAEEAMADKDVAYDRIHPEDMPKFILLAEEARVNGTLFDCTARHRMKNGQYRLMRTCSFPHTDEKGRLIFDGFLLAVDEKRKKSSTDELAAFLAPLESSEDIVLLLNAEGIVEYANKATEKCLSLQRTQILGEDLLGINDPESPATLDGPWQGELTLSTGNEASFSCCGELAEITEVGSKYLAVLKKVK